MKTFSLLAAVMLSGIYSAAQTPESKIALTPYVEYSLDRIPEAASRALERKLVSMTTANGFASVSGDFLITAIPDVLNTSVTATAPPKFVSEVEVAVYVVNNPEKIIVDQKVYYLKGLGTSEQKAVMNAISQINVSSADSKRFMDNVRTKMLDYYATRLPAIIAKAQSLASMSRYEEALAELAVVPESLDEYPQVADLMVDIYTGYIDREAKSIIADAKTKIAQQDYVGAFRELVKVDPNSTLFAESDAMISSITAHMEAERQAELKREMELYEQQRAQAQKEYEDSIDLEKQKLDASREIASMALSVGIDVATGDHVSAGRSVIDWLLGDLI